ncbi:MAG TPA: hypothetical protein VG755_42440 [Nannocystaceae bacterium]|nr:hypothetical protein [Nannocystaceae bacterium]
MGRRWGMALVCMVACGRSPLEGDTLASASGSGEATTVDGDSFDGPSQRADLPPPDEPLPDVGGALPPPGECATAPALPAAPSCDDPPREQRQLFDDDTAYHATLAVDDDWVYLFVTSVWEPAQIYRIDKCSGDAELIGSAGQNNGYIVAVDDHLIWTDFVDQGHVWQLPKVGGRAIAIADAYLPLGLVLADDWIFYASHDGVFRIPRSGGAAEPFITVDAWPMASLSYDGATLFAARLDAPSSIWIDPSSATMGSVAAEGFSDVVADCEWFFHADQLGQPHRIERATGATTPIGPPTYRFTQDATRLFASTGDSRVIAIDKQTGEDVLVGDVPDAVPWLVALDETHVYWTSADDGGLWVAPKP